MLAFYIFIWALNNIFQKSDDESFDDETPSWLSAKVAPYVAELPLPPDYYLKELREVLANYMQELNAEGV